MSNKKSKSSSVNFYSLLAIAFIVLKLTVEKLFIPRHQKYDKWQGTLFEGIL